MDLLNRAQPGRFYFIGAPTYAVLEDATWKTFIDAAESRKMLADVVESPRPWARLYNGAEIIGRSAEKPERFRGPNLSGAWLDEASQVKREAFDLLLPCLREGGTMGWLTGTFTPRGKAHWTYKIFGKNADGCELFKAKTSDSPFLPPEIEKLIRDRYTDQFAAQELDAEFTEGAQEIIPESWISYYETQGRILKAGGFVVDEAECRRFATIDTAGTSKDKAEEAKGKPPSWSVCSVWDYYGKFDMLYLRHVWRELAGWHRLKEGTSQTLKAWGVKKTYIENAHVGPQLGEELAEFGVQLVGPTLPGMIDGWRGAKVERAISAGLLERYQKRKLAIPTLGASPWVQRYFDEVTEWTGLEEEPTDQIDASSYAAWHCKQSASAWGGVIR